MIDQIDEVVPTVAVAVNGSTVTPEIIDEGAKETVDIEDDAEADEGEGDHSDVSLHPSVNADTLDEIKLHISKAVTDKYDVFSYRHAAAIFKNSFPKELAEIEEALLKFSITQDEIAMPGGNESAIPKKFSTILRPLNWVETRIKGDLVLKLEEHAEDVLPDGSLKKRSLPAKAEVKIENYIDGHKIDYVKGRVALDLEWNSKDQTFDRDLYAFRMFHDCGIISAAALVTRSAKLNDVFSALPLKDKNGKVVRNKRKVQYCIRKYGASTTWMGKLLYRMNAGRHGGCPVLIFGIRPGVISDWP